MWGSLSDEKSLSVLFSFCRASKAHPFSNLSPTGLMSIVCLYFRDSHNQDVQVPVLISPGNKVAQLYPRALDCKKTIRYNVFNIAAC
jgi:hypothetical protein